MGRWTRKVHVLATAIVGVQLVLWTGTGFAFTLFDFDVVRGTVDKADAVGLDLSAVQLTPADAAGKARALRGADTTVASVRLKPLVGEPVYEVSLAGAGGVVLVDAASGRTIPVDPDTAARVAARAFRGVVKAREVTRIPDEGRDVFVVHLDDPRATEVSVDAATGDVASWRNGTWRAFDALWSLHVLGYVSRSSPANWPLRIVSLVALLASASGAALLVTRLRRRRFFSLTPKETPWPVTKSQPSASDS